MIPLMLNEVSEGRLNLGRLVNAMSESPAARLGLNRGKISEGQTADFIMVDLNNSSLIKNDNLHSKAAWTPFLDWPAIFPSKVYRRGNLIVENGNVLVNNGGQNLFN